MRVRRTTVVLLSIAGVVTLLVPLVGHAEISECYWYSSRREGMVDGQANCTGSGFGCMLCFDNSNGGQCTNDEFQLCDPNPGGGKFPKQP